jgi:ABC-2 type transport system ATP-binding protein
MIRAHDLTKSYGASTAVDAISFEVAEGEIFAFLGPNGAGKTTTVKMLTTLLKPSSGLVEIDGLDPAAQQNEVRKRFGIVFQDSSTDDELTAYENMDFHGVLYKVPKKIRSTRIESLLKLFELWERRDDPVKRFSGGMRRRLEIARGFLHTPKILFLDEPTLGLDPQTRNQLWKHVQKLNQEERVTVFLTTHYMEEAERVAHRIAIIDHGRIVAQGQSAETPRSVQLRRKSRYRREAFVIHARHPVDVRHPLRPTTGYPLRYRQCSGMPPPASPRSPAWRPGTVQAYGR